MGACHCQVFHVLECRVAASYICCTCMSAWSFCTGCAHVMLQCSAVWSRVATLHVELLGVAFSELWPNSVIATIVVATMLLKQVACNMHLRCSRCV